MSYYNLVYTSKYKYLFLKMSFALRMKGKFSVNDIPLIFTTNLTIDTAWKHLFSSSFLFYLSLSPTCTTYTKIIRYNFPLHIMNSKRNHKSNYGKNLCSLTILFHCWFLSHNGITYTKDSLKATTNLPIKA
jgi:hypothetical protein